MIYHVTKELAALLDVTPKVIENSRASSLWGDWVCGCHLVNMDLGYPSDRVVVAVNTKTLFTVVFPFDAISEYEEFSQALTFFVYWTFDDILKGQNRQFPNVYGADILKEHFYITHSVSHSSLLKNSIKKLDKFVKDICKKNRKNPVVLCGCGIRRPL